MMCGANGIRDEPSPIAPCFPADPKRTMCTACINKHVKSRGSKSVANDGTDSGAATGRSHPTALIAAVAAEREDHAAMIATPSFGPGYYSARSPAAGSSWMHDGRGFGPVSSVTAPSLHGQAGYAPAPSLLSPAGHHVRTGGANSGGMDIEALAAGLSVLESLPDDALSGWGVDPSCFTDLHTASHPSYSPGDLKVEFGKRLVW